MVRAAPSRWTMGIQRHRDLPHHGLDRSTDGSALRQLARRGSVVTPWVVASQNDGKAGGRFLADLGRATVVAIGVALSRERRSLACAMAISFSRESRASAGAIQAFPNLTPGRFPLASWLAACSSEQRSSSAICFRSRICSVGIFFSAS
jgi:hypothetical protein